MSNSPSPVLAPPEPAKSQVQDQPLSIAGRTLRSRLFMGTAKYPSFDVLRQCLEVSGCEVVTVAIRRVNLRGDNKQSIWDAIDKTRHLILPNTAGCYTPEEALRVARMGKAAGMTDWVKLEVLADPDTLLPNPVATLEACKMLVKEGFVVLAYTSDDPVVAKQLEEAGAAAVMPLGAPIGTGQGILNPNNIRIILDRARVPIIVDAGVGTASDVTVAMELGADGVLLNSAVAMARHPVQMAEAMGHALTAGRLAHLAGRIPKRLYGAASSPAEGVVR